MQTFVTTGPYGELELLVDECGDAAAPVLVMAHGFRGSREGGGQAAALARQASLYCHALRFNFTGSQILSHQVQELKAVLAWVKAHYKQSKIFLLGRSLGGAASLITASGDLKVSGLILWATPNALRQTFRAALGVAMYRQLDEGKVLHMADERGELDLTPDFLTDFDRYDLQDLLRQWQSRPLLILHGDADDTVDVQQGKRSFALAGEPKELVIFPGGGHSLAECSEAARNAVCGWLERHR